MLKQILMCLAIFAAVVNGIEMDDWQENTFNEEHNQKLLSRRRRYLAFPEGSSLQLGKSGV